jgi:hypothetical protein
MLFIAYTFIVHSIYVDILLYITISSIMLYIILMYSLLYNILRVFIISLLVRASFMHMGSQFSELFTKELSAVDRPLDSGWEY